MEIEYVNGRIDRTAQWAAVLQEIGKRYADCRVNNFRISDDRETCVRQSAVVSALTEYGDHADTRIGIGQNIVLFGPAGTGKDHLLVGMAWQACKFGHSVKWVRGCDFFGDTRDAMERELRERDFIREYTRPDVLVLSDPVPPSGGLSQFQAVTLFRIVDRRYRDLKPTWVTLNAVDREDAEKRIGVQTVDRLREGALSLHCNWESYRGRKS